MKIPLFIAFDSLVGLASLILAARTPPKPALPTSPVELLKYLPNAPEGWQLKESKANSFYSEWLVSQATRVFEMRASKASSATPEPAASVTRIRLTDTGYYPVLFADFDKFAPGKYGKIESLYMATFPARRVTLPDGERLRILINKRFVVEIENLHQPPNSGTEWLQYFDLAALGAAPATAVDILPNPLSVENVDEMNPKANSSYEVSSSSEMRPDALPANTPHPKAKRRGTPPSP